MVLVLCPSVSLRRMRVRLYTCIPRNLTYEVRYLPDALSPNMWTAEFRREARPACVRFRVGVEECVLNCITLLLTVVEVVVDGRRNDAHFDGIFHFGGSMRSIHET